MPGLFHGTSLERPVTCEVCEKPLDACACPRDAGGRVTLPRDQKVTVRLEKRGKGKVVTTITGLDPAASDLKAILKTLKSACGSGGTIAGSVIEVQGDQRAAVASELLKSGYETKVK
jgi:translation initiation factor 1